MALSIPGDAVSCMNGCAPVYTIYRIEFVAPNSMR